jgi:rare lipoprotein A
MRRSVLHSVLAVLAFLAIAPSVAHAAPSAPPRGPVSYSVAATDSLTTNAIDLLVSLNASQAELASLDTRIAVVSAATEEQSATLDAAVRSYDEAQKVYDDRVVEMYQTGDLDILAILLDADSFSDLVARVEVVSRILDADRSALQEVEIVADQARFQSARLESLKTELVALQTVRSQRALSVTTTQASLTALELQLTFDGRVNLDAVRAAESSYRQAWVASSVPTNTVVPIRSVKVRPYPERYATSKFFYRTYETQALEFNAIATWRGDDFNGCVTMSGQTFNAADFTCAHPTLPIGTWIAVSRIDPKTQAVRRVIVVVNDRGPYVSGRDLQLTRAAADALGLIEIGSGTVQCEVVKPAP